jgi:hypothetical protein
MKRLKAENVNLEAFSLCLLEDKINNDLYFWKIFISNNGDSYNIFNVLDRNKKNIVISKRHSKFNTQYRQTINKLSDLFEFKFERTELARQGAQHLSEMIMDCGGKNFIYKKRLIKRYGLDKNDTFLSLFNMNEELFFKIILPYFWKFMDKKTFSFFLKKISKKSIDVSFNFFNAYTDKKFLNSLIDYNYPVDDERYLLLTLIQSKHNYSKINLAKLLDFFKKSKATDTNKILVLENILNNKNIEERDRSLFFNILLDNDIQIVNNPHFKKILNRNIS